jgi:hypothetical protein
MAFTWDDENTAHLEEYHPDIEPTDVDSIWQRRVVRQPNRGSATVLFLGVDQKGRLLAVPADPAGPLGTWRPRTAHQARSAWQRNAYHQDERHRRQTPDTKEDRK